MFAMQLKAVLDQLDSVEDIHLHVRLGEPESVMLVGDELVITLEFIDTGMGDDPPTFGALE